MHASNPLNASVVPEPAIYESVSALNDYLAAMADLREERARSRALKNHYDASIVLLDAQIEAAIDPADADILEQFCTARKHFEYLRAGLLSPAHPHPEAPSTPVEVHAATEPCSSEADSLSQFERILDEAAEAPSAPTPDFIRIDLLEEIRCLADDLRTLGLLGGPETDISLSMAWMFRARVVACRLRSIDVRSRNDQTLDEVNTFAMSLLEDLRQSLADTNGGLCFPLSGNNALVSHGEWTDLAKRYAQAAEAAEGLAWYSENSADVQNDKAQLLLNSVGASQELLRYSLDRLDTSDRQQYELYQALKGYAKEVGYLDTLSGKLAEDRLEEIAYDLPGALRGAQKAAAHEQDRREIVTRRESCIQALLSVCGSRPDFGLVEEREDEDRNKLVATLQESLANGVSATNPQVRSAMLECAPRLLAGVAECAKFLDAVTAERLRRKLDVPNDSPDEETLDEPTDAAMEEYVAALGPFVTGKRLLLLGGSPRQRTPNDLKQLLPFYDVQWKASKKSDKIAKFESDVKKCDMLIVLKNLAGHDMSEFGKKWMKETGGHFLVLPAGYGVKQIVHQLHQYCSRGVTA